MEFLQKNSAKIENFLKDIKELFSLDLGFGLQSLMLLIQFIFFGTTQQRLNKAEIIIQNKKVEPSHKQCL